MQAIEKMESKLAAVAAKKAQEIATAREQYREAVKRFAADGELSDDEIEEADQLLIALGLTHAHLRAAVKRQVQRNAAEAELARLPGLEQQHAELCAAFSEILAKIEPLQRQATEIGNQVERNSQERLSVCQMRRTITALDRADAANELPEHGQFSAENWGGPTGTKSGAPI